jgi:hypothetical protein
MIVGRRLEVLDGSKYSMAVQEYDGHKDYSTGQWACEWGIGPVIQHAPQDEYAPQATVQGLEIRQVAR